MHWSAFEKETMQWELTTWRGHRLRLISQNESRHQGGGNQDGYRAGYRDTIGPTILTRCNCCSVRKYKLHICTAYMQYIMHAMNTEQLSIYIKGSPTTHINICYLKIVIGANRSGVSNRFSSEGVEKTRFYHPAIGSRSLITNLATIKINSFWPCCVL